jgi:catechol 2,3-dioxygenase-like lactoylglutathione lyase family enzyme
MLSIFRTGVVGAILTAPVALAQNPTAPPQSFVTGVGNFSHIVADLDKSLAFYRDVIGLQPNAAPTPFSPNPAIMRLGNTLNAQSRFVALSVPGSAIGVELIDYKDIDRSPVRPRFQDPGAANLILRVRDLDAVLARVRQSGAKILSAGGNTATIGTTGGKVVFLQDLDGFVIELSQAGAPRGNPAAPAQAQPQGNIIGGGFELAVENTEKTVDFYRKVLGFQITAGTTFNNDKVMNETAGVPGGAFKQSRGPIPGANAQIVFIEFANVDRKPMKTRIQDPGTAILQVNVRDMDGLMKVLKANGVNIITTGGEPVSLGPAKLVIVRDPNNLFLEFIQR